MLSKIVGPTPPTLLIITSSIGANMTRGILKMMMPLMILIATDMQKAANLVNKFVLFFPNLCLFLAKICFYTEFKQIAQIMGIFMPIICI